MNVHELIRTMVDGFAGSASVRNVYGEPVSAGNRTVIPIAEVRYGFGAGGGHRNDEGGGEGGGGGGGVTMRPAGALEITPEGARFIRFDDHRRLRAAMAAGFSLGILVAMLTRKNRR